MRTLIGWGVLGALLSTQALAAGGSCILNGGPDMEFSDDGKPGLHPPYRADNCDVVKITKGKGTVHFINASGQRDTADVTAGNEVGKVVHAASAKSATLTKIFALLTGGSQVKSAFGGPRLKPDSRSPGFPAGLVVPSQAGYPVNFDDGARQQVTEFVLYDKATKQPLFRAINFNGVAIIPPAVVVPGRRYAWRMRTASGVQTGADFFLAEEEDVRHLQAMLADVARNSALSESDRLLAEAIALDNLGFIYDRDRVIHAFRQAAAGAR